MIYALLVLFVFIAVPVLIVLGVSIFVAAKQGDLMMSQLEDDQDPS